MPPSVATSVTSYVPGARVGVRRRRRRRVGRRAVVEVPVIGRDRAVAVERSRGVERDRRARRRALRARGEERVRRPVRLHRHGLRRPGAGRVRRVAHRDADREVAGARVRVIGVRDRRHRVGRAVAPVPRVLVDRAVGARGEGGEGDRVARMRLVGRPVDDRARDRRRDRDRVRVVREARSAAAVVVDERHARMVRPRRRVDVRGRARAARRLVDGSVAVPVPLVLRDRAVVVVADGVEEDGLAPCRASSSEM